MNKIWKSIIPTTVVALGMVAFAASVTPTAARAAEVTERSCICESGSGGCALGEYFCCEFDGSEMTCGCLFLGGLWHDCTNGGD